MVTGGLGHIGSHLIRNFDESVEEVLIIDNLSTQRYASLFDLPSHPRVRFFQEDIMTANLVALMKGVDVVVHLAAVTDAAGSFGKEEEVETINFHGLVRVAEACEAVGAKLFFPSTTSVYGSQEFLVDETCKDIKPQSPYAVSKIKAEEYLFGRRDSGLKFVVFRLGTIFGWSVGMRFHTAVNKFIWQAVNGQPITVWKTAWGQKRPYLDLNDCIRALNLVLKKDMFDGQLYNVVTNNFTVKEIVETIRKLIPSLEVTYVDSPIMNQLSYDVAAVKIGQKGFIPQGDLEKSIGGTIGHLKSIVRM